MFLLLCLLFFFFNDTATTEIYTLSLHDALPISLLTKIRDEAKTFREKPQEEDDGPPTTDDSVRSPVRTDNPVPTPPDRKSTRLNSSHVEISYAVFCLKKKKKNKTKEVPTHNMQT